jgi:hypothetical protein
MTIEVDPRRAGNPVLLEASLTVDGLTFRGATIDNSLGGNGAGIRDQNTAWGATLMVRNSVIANNQEGVLTGDDVGETIAVTNSKFENNGNPDPTHFQHALYVNRTGRLTVTDSLFCGQFIGYDIKSRALVTRIENNQIYDGEGHATAAAPVRATLRSTYPRAVAYGEEGLSFDNNGLSLSNNVDVTDPEGGTIAHYSENLLVDGAVRTKVLPLALNDKIGVWRLRTADLPSGGTATAELKVDP